MRNPEFHGAARIFFVFELMHLHREGSRPFEVRSRDVNFRARHFAVVDVALQFEVRVGLNAARRSNRSHASCQVQPGKTRGMLWIERRRSARRWVVHVVVHADKPGNDCAAGEIEHSRAFRNLCAGCVAERRDLSIANHQSLIGARSCARAVNHTRVRQSDQRRVFLYERAHFRCQLWCGLRQANGRQRQETESQYGYFSHGPPRGLSCRLARGRQFKQRKSAKQGMFHVEL